MKPNDRLRRFLAHISILLWACLLAPFGVRATTYWVTNTNDAGAGSFRDAVVNASLGDTVRFDSLLIAGGSDTIHLMSTVFMPAPLVFKGIYSDVDSIYVSGEGNVFPLASGWTGTQFQGEDIVLDSMFIINSGPFGGPSVSAFSTVFIDTLRIFNSAFMFNDAGTNGFAAAIKAENINVLHIKNSKFRNNIAGLEYSNIYCTGKELVIEQSSFFNGEIYQSTSSLSDGYTIYFDASNDTVNVDMVNVNFHNNQGGGIWIDVDGFLDLSLQDVTLDSNDCDGHDLLRATTSGFFVQADGLFIRGNTDAFNTVGIGGSPLGTILLNNAWVEGNTSELSNFSTSGTVEVDNSDFIANEATGSGSDGGAIRAQAVTVDGTSFIGNSCGDKGGAIYAGRSVAISNASFINNTTDESNFANGGAVYCSSDFTASNSNFKGNRAFDGGVVKCLGDDVSFVSCVVDSNVSVNDGGVAHLIWSDSATGSILIDSSTFTGNNAQAGGGVVFLESGVNTAITSSVNGSSFSFNRCLDDGAALWMDAADLDLELTHSSFHYNHDTTGIGGGLAITGNTSCSLLVEDVQFVGNFAGSGAGGLNLAHDGLQSVQMQTLSADSNTATPIRILSLADPLVEIVNASFHDNEGQPGALYLSLPNKTGFAIIDSCTIQGNSSGTTAGGLWANVNVHISHSDVSSNICTSTNSTDGGGLYAESNLIMENCVVSDNSASSGAGVYVKDADSLRLSDVTFDGNTGTLRGGGLYVDPSVMDVSMHQCDFVGNTAEVGGGVYMDLEVGASISHCLFKQNTATEDGGGLFARSIEDVTWSFTDSTRFIGNEADRDGGGVCIRHVTTNPGNIFVTARFNDARLDSNTAGRNGGAIALSAFQSFINTSTDYAKGVLEINQSSLARNEVTGLFPQFMTGSGGAVSMLGSDTLILEVDSSRMAWNEAFDRGGAVYLRASRSSTGKPSYAKASLDAATLDHNEAQVTGSAMAVIAFHDAGSNAPTVAHADIDVYRSTIAHNDGPSFGSALFASAGNGTVFSANKNKVAETRLEASTVAYNSGSASNTEILNWSGFYSSASTICKSSIVGMNGDSSFVSTISPALISQGYNAFDSLVSGYSPQLDLHGLDSVDFDLGPLQMNGGLTPTLLPGANSLVVNGGDPQNLDPAQNGSIVYQRDRGAAESNGCQFFTLATLEGCDSLYWAPGDTTFLSAVNDTFYFNSTLNCDSAVLLNVNLGSTAFFTELIDTCGSFTWTQTGLTYDSSGIFHDTVSAMNSCDSIFTLELTVQTLDTSMNIVPGGLSAAQAQASYQWIDCSTDSLLFGQDQQAFFPTTTGSFKVALWWQGCSDTTDCYTVLGLTESKTSALQVFPNPFDHAFQVLQDHPQPLQLEVYDALGALVYRAVSSSDQHTVDASSWAPGVYMLVLKDASDQSETRRMIKR